MTKFNQLVQRYIGEGAMGKVYELIGHERPAVIKYIACQNEKARQMSKNEYEALKTIDHANVVSMLSIEENGAELGIVMEYCQRGSLRDVIFNLKINYSMNTVLTWGIQLFDAIDHMYQKHGLVHRDIKPDNIFVTHEYQLKIGDFGLVKVVEDDETITGTFIGTTRYMSPPDIKSYGVQRDVYEQLKEADVSNSHRNDVYSLGLVMWEIVERRRAFHQYDRGGVFDRDVLLFEIVMKPYLEIELPNCQSELQGIILCCTSFRRFRRPTAGDALALLRRIATDDPFISTLSFLPKENKQQKSLIRPIGFNGEIDEIVVVYHREGKEIFQLSDATLTNNESIRAIAKLEEFDRSITIGRGGYGTAHLVTRNEKQMVIKIIDCQNLLSRKDRQKEYEILAMLRHQNVIEHHKTWALSEKEIGIEMEYCDRGTLKDGLAFYFGTMEMCILITNYWSAFLEQSVVLNPRIVYSMGQVIVWAMGLFGAIHYIFSKHRVIHRDIKPENIFVNNTFDPKLGDFGTAREVDETLSGTCIGTQRYMNPDVNNLSKASHRNDVYSMGLVLWEIIERSTVFIEYGKKFERDRFIIDISNGKLTELIPPESPRPIQEIVKKYGVEVRSFTIYYRCTVFDYRKRPIAKEIVKQLKQLDERGFFPTFIEQDEQMSELIRPIGFNGRHERVPVPRRPTEDHPRPSIQSTTQGLNFTTMES